MTTAESDTAWAFAPATEVAAAIARGEVASRELTELFLARIEAHNGELGSYGTRVTTRDKSSTSAAADPQAIGESAHIAQIADLLAAIDEDREPLMTGTAAREALELVLAVYASAQRDAPVTLPLG